MQSKTCPTLAFFIFILACVDLKLSCTVYKKSYQFEKDEPKYLISITTVILC